MYITFAFLTLAQLLSSALAEEYEFFRWTTPSHQGGYIAGRQVPGYHPEFGSCGSGQTCEDACGPGWFGCNASTTLSLFCYNPSLGQTCCENGSGRACDAHFYCAWTEFNGEAWCCKEGQNLEECGVPPSSSSSSSTTTSSTTTSTTSSTTTTTTSSTTTTPCPVSTVTVTGPGGITTVTSYLSGSPTTIIITKTVTETTTFTAWMYATFYVTTTLPCSTTTPCPPSSTSTTTPCPPSTTSTTPCPTPTPTKTSTSTPCPTKTTPPDVTTTKKTTVYTTVSCPPGYTIVNGHTVLKVATGTGDGAASPTTETTAAGARSVDVEWWAGMILCLALTFTAMLVL